MEKKTRHSHAGLHRGVAKRLKKGDVMEEEEDDEEEKDDRDDDEDDAEEKEEEEEEDDDNNDDDHSYSSSVAVYVYIYIHMCMCIDYLLGSLRVDLVDRNQTKADVKKPKYAPNTCICC